VRRGSQPPPLALPEPPEPLLLDPPPLLGAGLGAGAGAGGVYVGADGAGAVYVGVGAVWTGAVYVGAVAVDVGVGTAVRGAVVCVTGTRRGGSAFNSTAVCPAVPTDCSRAALRASASRAARALATAAAACATPFASGAAPTDEAASTGLAAGVACAELPPRAPSAIAPVATATIANPPATARSSRRARVLVRRRAAEFECSVVKLDICTARGYRLWLTW
jgi:hypothetical protein